MADNVTLPGTGSVVAADDVSGVLYQRVKLAAGGEGAVTADLDGRALAAGAALYVDARPVVSRIQVTPTVSAASAYTSGDCLGGLMTITDAARASGGSGVLQAVTVLDKDNERAAIDLLFFNQSVTSAGDNAAVAFSDTDMANCIGVMSMPIYNAAWPGSPANAISSLLGVALPYICVGTANLYCQAVVRSTPTYTATDDLIFSFTVAKD
jgi:hypothetical protein